MTIEYATRHRARSLHPCRSRISPTSSRRAGRPGAHLFGDLVTIYAGGEQTGEHLQLLHLRRPQGELIPAHSHADT
ncbi:hypothetical protein LT493_44035 [Streptomyces tricolor]|nr:hypothetical protein [Streptomyces tricolor]